MTRDEMKWIYTQATAVTNNGIQMIGFACDKCKKVTFIPTSMKTPSCCPWCGSSEEKKKALDVAFKAMEQEPCEDAISRQAVLDEFYDMENLYERIKQLPSVKPQDCDTCEVGNPCLYCKHEFEPQERSDKE